MIYRLRGSELRWQIAIRVQRAIVGLDDPEEIENDRGAVA